MNEAGGRRELRGQEMWLSSPPTNCVTFEESPSLSASVSMLGNQGCKDTFVLSMSGGLNVKEL